VVKVKGDPVWSFFNLKFKGSGGATKEVVGIAVTVDVQMISDGFTIMAVPIKTQLSR
tara:strand:+ start:1361 stop:1531 length:171 start_codon:yes stop_codon:yes gene_type:complete